MGSDSRRCRTQWSITASRLVLLALAISRASALSQQYCASFNTGTGKKTNSADFMTNGKCHDQCSGYAFAVVQYKDCWCSNIAPGGADPGSSCSVPCPGYPYESCGDKDQGLFGYVALGPKPSSTQGGSEPSSSPSQQEDSSTPQPSSAARSPVTVQDTVTETPSVTTSIVSVTPSTTPRTSVSTTSRYVPVSLALDSSTTTSDTPTPTPTTTPSTSKSSKSSSWKPTPVVTVQTVTGKIRTFTVTPTEPPQSTQTVVRAVGASKDGGFFSSPGKVAGTFVAVAIILLAGLAGLLFFLWRRRRRQQDQETLPPSVAGSGGATPQRRPSRMSQMGLLGSTREKNSVPQIQTSGWGPGTSGEKSPADTLDKRSSYPRVVDQRLDPGTVPWNPIGDNGSRGSIRSFRDDQDYSRRVLQIANPD